MKKKKRNSFNPVIRDLELKVRRPEDQANRNKEAHPEKDKGFQDDRALFLDAISGAKPLSGKDIDVIIPAPRNPLPVHPPPDDELEGLMHLQDLIKGSIEMDISFSDEYIEGAISGVSRKIMKRLKQGHIPIQDYIDLHGLTQQKAEIEVRNFLINSSKRGLRCVLIVHGRGLNSPDSIPVLKERLPTWLNRGPARKIVLAFASARPYDGGTGAIYVLLRKG
ncbi:MAG: Smr/MutS family protein [Deltaproteobacteria bacterium]|nr:Smr/MutS family protein [Deltaproteobacteria bacterium]